MPLATFQEISDRNLKQTFHRPRFRAWEQPPFEIWDAVGFPEKGLELIRTGRQLTCGIGWWECQTKVPVVLCGERFANYLLLRRSAAKACIKSLGGMGFHHRGYSSAKPKEGLQGIQRVVCRGRSGEASSALSSKAKWTALGGDVLAGLNKAIGWPKKNLMAWW